MNNPLLAVSPIDGRYSNKTSALGPSLSEYGLIYNRLLVEIRWLEALSACPLIKEVPKLSLEAKTYLNKIIASFNVSEAEKVKAIEAKTNHDLKAVEYYLKDQLSKNQELDKIKEFVHFACTSEDINNLAYALMLKQARDEVILPGLNELQTTLKQMAHQYAAQPMLARTHGQPATPTTVGKEIANFHQRLKKQIEVLNKIDMRGKFNGAVGNYNAHLVAYPDIDWPKISYEFVTSLGLGFQAYSTQIEPHDFLAGMFHSLVRINTIYIGFCRDIWSYISLGYFKQKVMENEVGSSTMPHKVNPIDFENAEGNLGLANALLSHLAEKLPISRWQRDLTDSTVLRNIGPAFGYSLIAYQSFAKGLSKLAINTEALDKDLNSNWEVLAEAIQTVMRVHGIEQPYEKLKMLTRGKSINQESLHQFIDQLDLAKEVKLSLKKLSPQNYVGLAEKLAKNIE